VRSLPVQQFFESDVQDPRFARVVSSLRSRLLERLRAGALELPLLPQVATQVLAMASNEDSDARQLADLLRKDPAMTAHVLRVVNSPFYRARASIDSLEQATRRLGHMKVRQIALVIACKQRVFRARGFEPEVYKSFRHSLAAAFFAERIARVRQVDQEPAFVAGLLHDVGRPVLLQAVVDLDADARVTDAPAVLAVVAELHTLVGGMLAQKWRLPAQLAAAIAYHHDPLACPSSSPLPMIVNLADDLAVGALETTDLPDAGRKTHWTLPYLGIGAAAVELLVAQRSVLLESLQAVA